MDDQIDRAEALEASADLAKRLSALREFGAAVARPQGPGLRCRSRLTFGVRELPRGSCNRHDGVHRAAPLIFLQPRHFTARWGSSQMRSDDRAETEQV